MLFIENLHVGRKPEYSQTVDALVCPEAPIGKSGCIQGNTEEYQADFERFFAKKPLFLKKKFSNINKGRHTIFGKVFLTIYTCYDGICKKSNAATAILKQKFPGPAVLSAADGPNTPFLHSHIKNQRKSSFQIIFRIVD
ncbi:hypothetical protein [Dyadobacter sp. MSC1_007]|uniref:hypothetical protein n=1 Tax=Dyadobacter sp. MSC1_007 TaxID=2909264 RepID=UPI00202E71C4|nr:hypothetical protein [Dyadobacter sp. MSC1_007]